MEALLKALVAKYGYPYAAKLLGIDKQEGNPKYAISIGGQNLNLGNMVKRNLLNQGIKNIASGGGSGIMAPALLFGGSLALGYARNPLRPGSMNYNPELQGQLDYLSSNSMIDRNNSFNRLRYNKNSILNNQNTVSLFGTNDYAKQLQKYRDKYKDTMPKERLERLDREIYDEITNGAPLPTRPDNYFNPNERDGGLTISKKEAEEQKSKNEAYANIQNQIGRSLHGSSQSDNSSTPSPSAVNESMSSNQDSYESAAYDFKKGGIASL